MAISGGHLQLRETRLPATEEWTPPAEGWCFVRVEAGEGYWLGQPVVHELGPGDMLIFSAAEPGTLRASRLGPMRLHHFQFSPELLTGFLTMAERLQFEEAAALRSPGARLMPAAHVLARQFSELSQEPAATNPLFQRCKMVELVAGALAEEVRQQPTVAARHASANDRFIRVIHPMPDSELIRHTPSELSRMCGCSLRHFSRLFRQHFAVSIRAKQTELRIARARQLLTDPEVKIINVAMASGYRHLGLFNSTFKRHLGMTPSEWRRQYGESSRNGDEAHAEPATPALPAHGAITAGT